MNPIEHPPTRDPIFQHVEPPDPHVLLDEELPHLPGHRLVISAQGGRIPDQSGVYTWKLWLTLRERIVNGTVLHDQTSLIRAESLDPTGHDTLQSLLDHARGDAQQRFERSAINIRTEGDLETEYEEIPGVRDKINAEVKKLVHDTKVRKQEDFANL